jgi:ADP-ribose pyrophosphatase
LLKRKSKKFKVKKRKVLFSKGPIRLVDYEVLMPGGKVLSRQILEHDGAVVIIPRVAKNRFILIRQFRFATGGWIWEFPAGGVEPGETGPQAAARELTEEVSFRPGRLTEIVSFYPTPGVSAEKMRIFLAENLTPAVAEKDEDEDLEVHEFSLEEIGRMIKRREIIDGKTIVGYYLLKDRRRNAPRA